MTNQMTKQKPLPRRDFFKSAATILGAAIVIPSLFKNLPEASAEQKRASKDPGADSLDILDEKNPTAMSLKYVANHATAKDPLLTVERQGVAFAKQACSGCSLYQLPGEKSAKGSKYAPCQVMINQQKGSSYYVSANGVCTAWMKRQG